MKKLTLLVAVATMLTSTLGCNCCRNMFAGKTHTVARPVFSSCESGGCSQCETGCNSCGSSAPMQYGGQYGGVPTQTYMGPTEFSGSPDFSGSSVPMPMEIPVGSGGQ